MPDVSATRLKEIIQMAYPMQKQLARLESLFDSLWPMHRTIIGKNFDDSLAIIEQYWEYPWDVIYRIPSGTELPGGWVVPKGWECKEGYIEGDHGQRLIDYSQSTLRVISHSKSIDERGLTWDELSKNLHRSSSFPNAIPYITSYYSDINWGFSVTWDEYEKIRNFYKGGRVRISTAEYNGHLSIAERHFGNTDNYIIVSTYLCHPSMANNELSGPLVVAALIERLENAAPCEAPIGVKFLMWPETIGPIAYKHIQADRLRSGQKPVPVIHLSCLGLDRPSFEIVGGRSHSWNLQIAKALNGDDSTILDWRHRGSDERQFNFPSSRYYSATVGRGMFGTYPEYHTSADDKDFISFPCIIDAADKIYNFLSMAMCIERPFYFLDNEPFLSKFELYPSISRGANKSMGKALCELLYYCDGLRTKHEIACAIPWRSEHELQELFKLGYELGYLK